METPTVDISSLMHLDNGTYNVNILARVTIKSIELDNEKNVYFYMDLKDNSGEISAVAFDGACKKFFSKIEQHKTYIFQRFSLRAAQKAYTSVKHDKELVLEVCSELFEVNAPKQITNYDFVPLGDIGASGKYFYNVIALWDPEFNEDTDYIPMPDGRIKSVRKISLRDETTSMDLSVWNSETELFDDEPYERSVVLLKDARVQESWSGNLSLTTTRYVQILDIIDQRAAKLVDLL